MDSSSQLIARMRNARVVVVGDLIADQFISGQVSRVSREAPVLILQYDRTTIVPGGAGNAAANAAALATTSGSTETATLVFAALCRSPLTLKAQWLNASTLASSTG